MSFKIKKNFLTPEEYLPLKNILESSDFPWFFQKISVKDIDDKFDFHFCHTFYINDTIHSEYFNLLKPIINKLKSISLIRIKANLTLISPTSIKSAPHYDQDFNCKIALYYLNTNNGYTGLGKEKVKAVENTIVLFNSDVEHYATTCTDKQKRITINFNYV